MTSACTLPYMPKLLGMSGAAVGHIEKGLNILPDIHLILKAESYMYVYTPLVFCDPHIEWARSQQGVILVTAVSVARRETVGKLF